MSPQELHYYYKLSKSISTDSRTVKKGDIYFALKGENFNGNNFAENAIQKGASFAVVDDHKINNPKFLKVKNSLESLQELAKLHRSKLLKTKVIALTGSNGKTTTKELINEVLKTKFKVCSTYGNLNNHIGVPLTLLSIDPSTEIAVIEMGANHLNEIKFLTEMINPDYGLITNFGKAHLEGFGSIEGVIKGKSELYDYLLNYNKTAFIDGDDKIQNLFKGNKISFSKDKDSNYNFKEIKDSIFSGINFKNQLIRSNLTGNYNYSNIAFATLIGLHFGIDIKKIKKAILSYIPSNNRSQIIEKKGKSIVLDAYNANPTSMISALNSFSEKKGTKSIILGDMFELGLESDKEHKELINFCLKNNFDDIFLIGNEFYKHKHSFNQPNFYKTKDELSNHLKKMPLKSELILIKGSRGMKMENVIKYIF